MNVIQIMRRARQGVDAILPGGYASGQWPDEEVCDLVNEAYESMQREFRLVQKKWGLVTLNISSAAFTREGETYTPSSALVLNTAAASRLTLPPDFAELVRITCTNNRSIRFFPANTVDEHWIDLEQGSYESTSSTPDWTEPAGLVFYYDIIDNRTLVFNPPVTGTFNLEIDYIPMKRPLYYSSVGSVSITTATTAITGTLTRFSLDNIYASGNQQKLEIIVGVNDPQGNGIRVDRDYPEVVTVTSDTAAVLKANYGEVTVDSSPYIMAMVPTFPREYHRWLARLTSSLMLSKVNPDVSEKYFSKFMDQFKTQINPTIRRRNSQSSPIVEDSVEFGTGDY